MVYTKLCISASATGVFRWAWMVACKSTAICYKAVRLRLPTPMLLSILSPSLRYHPARCMLPRQLLPSCPTDVARTRRLCPPQMADCSASLAGQYTPSASISTITDTVTGPAVTITYLTNIYANGYRCEISLRNQHPDYAGSCGGFGGCSSACSCASITAYFDGIHDSRCSCFHRLCLGQDTAKKGFQFINWVLSTLCQGFPCLGFMASVWSHFLLCPTIASIPKRRCNEWVARR